MAPNGQMNLGMNQTHHNQMGNHMGGQSGMHGFNSGGMNNMGMHNTM